MIGHKRDILASRCISFQLLPQTNSGLADTIRAGAVGQSFNSNYHDFDEALISGCDAIGLHFILYVRRQGGSQKNPSAAAPAWR
jgi:hypothetical protein